MKKITFKLTVKHYNENYQVINKVSMKLFEQNGGKVIYILYIYTNSHKVQFRSTY